MSQLDLVVRDVGGTTIVLFDQPVPVVAPTEIVLCPVVAAPAYDWSQFVIVLDDVSGGAITLRDSALPPMSAQVVRICDHSAGGPVTRTFVLGATEAQDEVDFAVSVTGGGANLDLFLAAQEAQDAANMAATLGHGFTLGALEAQDVAAFVMDLTSSERQVSGSGAFGYYPQPSNTAEWLGKIPAKAARRIERTARKARREGLDEDEAGAALQSSILAAGMGFSQDYLRALHGLLEFEVARVAELARHAEFMAAQQKRNNNALRVLMLMSLH